MKLDDQSRFYNWVKGIRCFYFVLVTTNAPKCLYVLDNDCCRFMTVNDNFFYCILSRGDDNLFWLLNFTYIILLLWNLYRSILTTAEWWQKWKIMSMLLTSMHQVRGEPRDTLPLYQFGLEDWVEVLRPGLAK